MVFFTSFLFFFRGYGLRGLWLLLAIAGTNQANAKGAYRRFKKEVVYPSDPAASESSRNVFQNLKYLVDNGYFMFGQEFPTDFQWSKERVLDDNPEDSDCKDVVGQHPAVFGSDFHYYLESTLEERAIHLRSVKAAHSRGALITFDWHLSSPENRGGAFYVNEGNKDLLEEITAGMTESGQCVDGPDGMCTWYFGQVDRVIEILNELDFTVAFRPLHEMTGFWFWWGNLRSLGPRADGYGTFAYRYKKLYRALVEYTRRRGIHNLLYVWSPSNEINLDFYPGDSWVDILGLDVYEPGTVHGPSLEQFKNELRKLTGFADHHGKIAVLAETGFRMGYPEAETRFWTQNVLKPIIEGPEPIRVAWVLSWMNAKWERSPYIPYLGMPNQSAIHDFWQFLKAPQTLFEGDFTGIETSKFVVRPLTSHLYPSRNSAL